MQRTYRFNRAVGAHNKGDEFTADSGDAFVQSLLGAGYADPVLDEDEDDNSPAMFSDFKDERPK